MKNKTLGFFDDPLVSDLTENELTEIKKWVDKVMLIKIAPSKGHVLMILRHKEDGRFEVLKDITKC